MALEIKYYAETKRRAAGSPASGQPEDWHAYSKKLTKIISELVPVGTYTVSSIFYEVSRCFQGPNDFEKYEEYITSRREEWYCLSSLLALGIEDVYGIDNDSPTCDECKRIGHIVRCVQVEHKLSTVRVRTIDIVRG